MTAGIAAVFGLGRSGIAVARFLSAAGQAVRGLDIRHASDLELGRLGLPELDVRGPDLVETDLEGVEVLYVSPGVAWDHPLVNAARNRGIEVSSELQVFLDECRTPVLAITGTNGKTTTAHWTHHIVTGAGATAVLAGNVGVPALDQLEQARAADWVVLEVSSYQLESLRSIPFAASALLNITPDHLARHGSLANYARIKGRVATEGPPDGLIVLNLDDPLVAPLEMSAAGRMAGFSLQPGATTAARLRGDWVVIGAGDGTPLLPADSLPVPGRHNLENAMAAALLAAEAGVAPEQISAGLASFAGVEHRIEPVGDVSGVRFYNDSKATNPESTLSALAALVPLSLVLIAGGRSKGTDLGPLAATVARRCAAAVVIGEAAPELERAFRVAGLARVEAAADMTEAVERALSLAKPGQAVLLSPACASFDMFLDFEDRGRSFKSAVARLAAGMPR